MEVDWSKIRVNDVVQSGKTGLIYRVDQITGDGVTLWRNGSTTTLKSPKGRVQRVLSPSSIERSEQRSDQVRLGGRRTATAGQEDGIYQVPVEYSDPGSLRAHVYLLHGRKMQDSDYLPGLIAEHVALHRPENKALEWVAHHHNPDFLRTVQPGAAPLIQN